MRIRTLALAAALGTSLALTGCAAPGSDDMDHDPTPAGESAPAGHNDADVAFAAGMKAHHEQAIEMSDLLLAKDGVDPAVAELAEQIKAAQGPEIDTMSGWLEEWGGGHAGHSGGSHEGMMSDDDLGALESAEGAEASRLFLEQMIEHHEGAITMARAQMNDGVNADAVDLAETIIETQGEEITLMRELLGGL